MRWRGKTLGWFTDANNNVWVRAFVTNLDTPDYPGRFYKVDGTSVEGTCHVDWLLSEFPVKCHKTIMAEKPVYFTWTIDGNYEKIDWDL